jgi:hypothetical protein
MGTQCCPGGRFPRYLSRCILKVNVEKASEELEGGVCPCGDAVPQLEFDETVATCAARNLLRRARGLFALNGKGECAVRQGSCRVETAQLAVKRRYDGSLTGLTLRVSPDQRSWQSATACVAAGR